ncbi:unnamed protein product, partial [Staurois parvus]
GPAASGICHVSQVPPYHSQRALLLAHAHLGPGCHAHYRSREDSAPLDRGTGKMTADLWGGGERVPEFDRYPLLLPQLFFDLTCSSIQPHAVFPASVMALGMT